MDHRERYLAEAHAMQTGVAAVMGWEELGGETSPKHLRVGVNSAMVEHSALAQLLMEKGIITEDEYLKALADGMEEERKKYEKRIQEHYPNGPKFTLA